MGREEGCESCELREAKMLLLSFVSPVFGAKITYHTPGHRANCQVVVIS